MNKRLFNIKLAFSIVVFISFALFVNTNYLYSNNVESITSIDQIINKSEKKIEYRSVTSALKLKYTDVRSNFASDKVFANFRNVNAGNIKDNILYRGASPIDNSRKRAKYANDLMKEANIQYDVDLSDSEDKVKKHINKGDCKSDYFLKLYNDNNVCMLHMQTNYTKEDYDKKVVDALINMSKHEGPYYVHCVEGQNRTGFVCMILEALTGASYEEIVNDYMISYENYYKITELTNKEKYDNIKTNCIDNMLRFIVNDVNEVYELKDVKWDIAAKNFLLKNGMGINDINILINKLTK